MTDMSDQLPQIPVVVIGGYLGAGKTTLVNQLLRQANGLRLAVLVNEFGELPIDGDLIENQDDNIINIAGGCVCCSYGSDLMAALINMGSFSPAPDYLLIEASGVALPSSIAQSVQLIQRFTLEGVVVLADAETIRDHGKDQYLSDTIKRQLAAADLIVLNKTDLPNDEQLVATRHWISCESTHSRIIETVSANVALPVLLGIRDNDAINGIADTFEKDHAQHQSLVFQITDRVDPEILAEQLVALDTNLVRAKGFIRGLDGSHHTLQIVGKRWSVSDAPETVGGSGRIICITRNQSDNGEAISRIIEEVLTI